MIYYIIKCQNIIVLDAKNNILVNKNITTSYINKIEKILIDFFQEILYIKDLDIKLINILPNELYENSVEKNNLNSIVNDLLNKINNL